MTQSDQLRKIKEKLRPEYKQLISFKNPTTLFELRQCCMRIEAGFSPKKKDSDSEIVEYAPRKGSSYRPFNKTANLHNAKQAGPNRSSGRVNMVNQASSSAVDGARRDRVIFYNCNKAGHFARDCSSDQTGETKRITKGKSTLSKITRPKMPREAIIATKNKSSLPKC